MLLALTRRGNYTGRERIKGEAVYRSQKKGSKSIIVGGGGYVLAEGISCYPLSYMVSKR